MPVQTNAATTAKRPFEDVHVIVVEDDEMMARLMTHMLDGEAGLTMTPGGSDVNALMHEEIWRDVNVALVDLYLPRPTGHLLLTWLASHAPHVRRIAMSGNGDALSTDPPDAHVRLLKPFDMDDLFA